MLKNSYKLHNSFFSIWKWEKEFKFITNKYKKKISVLKLDSRHIFKKFNNDMNSYLLSQRFLLISEKNEKVSNNCNLFYFKNNKFSRKFPTTFLLKLSLIYSYSIKDDIYIINLIKFIHMKFFLKLMKDILFYIR